MRVETLIIGGGVAGAAMAHALRDRDVLVLEEMDEVAASASGNAAGLIKPFLSIGNSKMREFYHAAYHHALTVMDEGGEDFILQQGILQLPKPGETRFAAAPHQAGLAADHLQFFTAHEASQFLKTECRSNAIYWPKAVVVDPRAWVRALLGGVRIQTQTRVLGIQKSGTVWACETSTGETFTAKNVVIATGHAAHLLPPGIAAQIRPRAGQVTGVPCGALPCLPSALTFGHYWIPPQGDSDGHTLGATYEPHGNPAITADGHARNLGAMAELAVLLPEIAKPLSSLSSADCTGRAAVRATTPNHMPLFGMAEDGLYYLTGLGSRGLMSAPYVVKCMISSHNWMH